MNLNLSSLRSQLRDLQNLLPTLLESSLGRDPLLPGSVYTLRRMCGKPSCHCRRGELHESTVLSYRGQGRPQNISPAPDDVESLRKMTDHYRRCRQDRAQLVRWQRQLLKLVDDLQAVGRKRRAGRRAAFAGQADDQRALPVERRQRGRGSAHAAPRRSQHRLHLQPVRLRLRLRR